MSSAYKSYCTHTYNTHRLTVSCCFFFQAEDGIRDLVRSRGLGDVYKRQAAHGLDLAYPRGIVRDLPSAISRPDLVGALGLTLSLIHI